MSTTVTFAGNLAEAPELHQIRETNRPFVTYRVLVNRRIQNDEGEWVSAEPTAHNVTKDVVVVDNRFGEVALSLKYVSARTNRAPHAAQAS